MLRGMALDPILSAAQLESLTDVVLVDCRADDAKYRAGHVRGAVHAHLDRDLASSAPEPARGGRHPLPALQDFSARLGRWGVTPSSHVVAYDDQNGANAASRLWWLLKALGHERVQVVDGGLAALQAAGFELTTELPMPRAAPAYPASGWVRPLADIHEVERARLAQDRRVIDVRSAFRYRGESEPIDPIAGHIPGAHNVPLTENLNADGTWKNASELKALYLAALGGVPAEAAVIHCGSGVTACHTLLALERAGLRGAKLYVGSWSEWCRNPARPREPA
jgi:thiosulfate/3-mercaptopyruvate sulfurtransferase